MKNDLYKDRIMADCVKGDKGRKNNPLTNKVKLANRCCNKSYPDAFPMQRYYRGKWFSFTRNGYKQVSKEEIEGDITLSLTHCYDLNGVVSSDLRRDVLDILQTNDFYGLPEKEHQMPFLISTGTDASRILLMKNGYICVDTIMDTMKAGRPRPKTKETTPDLFSTWTKDYDYVSTARCPKFLKFLKEIQPDKANREMLQMMAGLCLIPDCSYERFFVLCGIAGSGKTTFLKVLKAMFGKNCYCSIPLAKLHEESNGVLLTEKLVNISSDMSLDAGTEHTEAFLQMVASGEDISIYDDNGNGPRWAKVTARCIFETNNLPRFSDKSNGVWGRLCLIPFHHVFRGTPKQNPHLADELIEQEMSGILNWALEGLFKLRTAKTFPLSKESLGTIIDWRKDCDSPGAYLMARIEVNPQRRLEPWMIYDNYTHWAEEHGIQPVERTELMKCVLRTYPTIHIQQYSKGYWLECLGFRYDT